MRTLVKFLALALVMVTGSVTAQEIATTAHDLSSGTASAADGNRICVYCHTPHNSNPDATAMPLWNRDLTAASFTMYDSPTMDMFVAAQPQGVSLACLGCHDGTIAYDSLFWGGDVIDGGSNMNGNTQVGPDLTGDHPISVTYNNSGGANSDTAFVNATAGKVVDLPLFGTGADQLECASCHMVHNDANGMFLRKLNTNSDLCLTCHIK